VTSGEAIPAAIGGDLVSGPSPVFDGATMLVLWDSWHSLGGQVLAGTGPTAAYLDGSTYVMVAGTDHQLYIEQVGVTGFVPAGGQTTASPALTGVPGTDGQPDASGTGFRSPASGAAVPGAGPPSTQRPRPPSPAGGAVPAV
jgi:hypothetical protein